MVVEGGDILYYTDTSNTTDGGRGVVGGDLCLPTWFGDIGGGCCCARRATLYCELATVDTRTVHTYTGQID